MWGNIRILLVLATFAKSLALVSLAASLPPDVGAGPGAGRLDIVNPPNALLNLDAPLTITVVARGLPITLQGAVFAVTDDLTGKDLSSAFSLSLEQTTSIKAETASKILISVSKQSLGQTVSATGGLIFLYKAGKSPELVASSSWGFKMTHPVPDLTVSSRPNDITRMIPFTPVVLTAADKTACLSYQVSPALLPIPPDLTVTGDEFTAKADGSRPEKGKIDAVFTPSQLCFETNIPGPYTELKAKFHLQNPSVKKPVDFDADLRVKDHWLWRALAALLATLPSLALIYWTTTVRRRILNGNEREAVANRLALFLSSNPTLGNHDSVVFVRQMILDSVVEDRTGDFDASVQSLASANSRLDQLVANPPTVSVTVSQSGQAIRILNPPSCLVAGSKISFVIGEPNANWPTSGGTYAWSVVGADGTVVASSEGVELKRFDCKFSTSGSYDITVAVNKANQESRNLAVLAEPSPGIMETFKIIQTSVVVITFLIAAGTAYATTQDAITFGTFGDYIKLIASAFGVSGGVGGVATVLTAVRGH
jgi:hypothetical protein